MLGSLYDRLAAEPGGLRELASARLRHRVLTLLRKALGRSGMSQSDLAKKLRRRRSAVNQVFRGDGNVRIDTLAEYLHELGFELDLNLVPAGEHRRAFEERRSVRSVSAEVASVTSITWKASPTAVAAFGTATSNPVVPRLIGTVG